MKAKLLVQSDNINTYINVMAALCDKYPVKQIMLSFVGKEPDNGFVNEIQSKLVNRSSNPIYSKASRVLLEYEIASSDHVLLVKGWDILDVTGVSKEIAVNISAASISNKKVHVCQLSWKERFKRDDEWVLKQGNHEYTDLMGSGALSNLYYDHFQKRHVIIAFAALFLIIFGVAIAKMIWPSFLVPEDVINLFSLLIGAAGLYLAIMSLKSKNA
jgi:hypothetical protein